MQRILELQKRTNTIIRVVAQSQGKFSRWCGKGKFWLEQFFENLKAIGVKSASDTYKFLGQLNFSRKYGVFLKMSFVGDPKQDNSLQVEQQIYENVTNVMIERHYTPCLVACYGVFKV